ncbi:MAG: pantothenate kinase, partial [SAR86 cluster bacterium]|nr:pantothenate kinase [SAR86 cluster bacterium]
MKVAIDFGISNTDLAVSSNDEIFFHSAPSLPAKIDSNSIRHILEKHDIDISNVQIIGVTGGK